jgi:hypothetical protein
MGTQQIIKIYKNSHGANKKSEETKYLKIELDAGKVNAPQLKIVDAMLLS